MASGSGAVDVDTPLSGDANVEAHNTGAGNVEGTPVSGGDEPVNESQIMLTATSHTTLGGSGDGMLRQRDIMSKLILYCSSKLHYVSKVIQYCLTLTLEQASYINIDDEKQSMFDTI